MPRRSRHEYDLAWPCLVLVLVILAEAVFLLVVIP